MTIGAVLRNEATAEWFDATAQGRFLIGFCHRGHASRPQATRCPECGSEDLRWEEASGRARLVSWVVVPWRVPDGQAAPPPLVPAIAELEEGPWWWSVLVDADPSLLRGDEELRIEFQRTEGSEAVPVFVLAPC